jgi:hypothetical protein
MEVEDIKRKIEGEAELTIKFDTVRAQLEKDIENLKSMLTSLQLNFSSPFVPF